MDEHLSRRNHLDAVCTKLSRSVGVIFRLKFILPERVLITLYKSIILPYLTYCNVAWGNTFNPKKAGSISGLSTAGGGGHYDSP